jgi:nucleoside phosphorylase
VTGTPTLGITTAIDEEFVAMRSLLDNWSEVQFPGEHRRYVIGSIPSATQLDAHEVVLTMIGRAGNDTAADACTHLIRDFPSVSAVIMVGIACGVPNPMDPARHVRLGDVVVAEWGIVDYDHVDETDEGPRPRPGLPPPWWPLVQACAAMRTGSGPTPEWIRWLDLRRHPDLAGYGRPSADTDILYSIGKPPQRVNHPDPVASGHQPGLPKVHYGLIGSGDRSLRSASFRDAVAARDRVLAFEMEGKGVSNSAFLNDRGWFVVRGISDYGDNATNPTWRRYAALAAAAYTRGLLAMCTPITPRVPNPKRRWTRADLMQIGGVLVAFVVGWAVGDHPSSRLAVSLLGSAAVLAAGLLAVPKRRGDGRSVVRRLVLQICAITTLVLLSGAAVAFGERVPSLVGADPSGDPVVEQRGFRMRPSSFVDTNDEDKVDLDTGCPGWGSMGIKVGPPRCGELADLVIDGNELHSARGNANMIVLAATDAPRRATCAAAIARKPNNGVSTIAAKDLRARLTFCVDTDKRNIGLVRITAVDHDQLDQVVSMTIDFTVWRS